MKRILIITLVFVGALSIVLTACVRPDPQGGRQSRDAVEQTVAVAPTSLPAVVVEPTSAPTSVPTVSPTATPGPKEVWYIVAEDGDCRNAIFGVPPEGAKFECGFVSQYVASLCPNPYLKGVKQCDFWVYEPDPKLTLSLGPVHEKGNEDTGAFGDCQEIQIPVENGTLTVGQVLINRWWWLNLHGPCRGYHN